MSDICAEKHKAIDATLMRHEGDLESLGGRVGTLEKSDASKTTAIDNLCKQIGGQTKAIWGLISALITMLAGFLLTYIQNLPKGP